MDYKKLIYKKAKKLEDYPLGSKLEDTIFCQECDIPRHWAKKRCELCNKPLCLSCAKWYGGLDFCHGCEINNMAKIKEMAEINSGRKI